MQRHQLVYAALGERMREEIHAMSMRTLTPEEWKAGGPKVYALTDYYEGGREHYRAWMEAAFGYTDDIIGSHAGIRQAGMSSSNASESRCSARDSARGA